MVTCTHTRKTERWLESFVNDWGDEEGGEWVYETVNTTVDIDVGRYKCTQCNLVMYYTGHWRNYHEKGIPCFGSEKVKRNA